jgi:hypothetical protein
VLAGGLTLFALAAAILWIPWFTEDRGVLASTPVPPPLYGLLPVKLAPGQTACLSQVTFSPRGQVAELSLVPGAMPGPPLAVTASAPGYHATAQIPAGYKDDYAYRFPIAPPAHSVIGQFCVRNAGSHPMSVNTTNEFRSMGRPSMTIDGALQTSQMHLSFYERKPSSYADRITDIFSHASVFTPPFLPAGVLIAIAVLALAGIPAGVLYAFASALGKEDE